MDRGVIAHIKHSEQEINLMENGFEQKRRDLYRVYQEGEISLGFLAEKLGMTTWQVHHLLEERGWLAANV